ncbi:hypothetical protein EI77_01309 [Prosthecobacter fusiformis]|uniref:Uncharacterized protein n=1 Tax=Prosthecobacter fusiformis TaxID=48464 RepID=A0A4V3FG05_9BACT|nr:hypothetical protein EI77_01309 [Prosthecobacter fusiformis]
MWSYGPIRIGELRAAIAIAIPCPLLTFDQERLLGGTGTGLFLLATGV